MDGRSGMKQVIRKGLTHMIVDEVPEPVVAPHHVLVRPAFSLISSGTETADIHKDGVLKEVAENPSHLRRIYQAMKIHGPARVTAEVVAKFSEYAVLGYAGAGYVVDKHRTVDDLEIGSRVAYGGEGTGHGETIQAGRNLIVRVPDGVRLDQACFATLGSIAMNAVRNAAIEIGEVVAVIGQGLIGQLIAQLVRLQGGSVVAIDLRPDRVALSRTLGADHGMTASIAEGIKDVTDGRGVDCAIVAAAAKSASPCRQALEICRDRGRIVIVGAVEIAFPWTEMYLKEIRLFMARAYGPGSYDAAYEKEGRDYPLPYVRWTENRNMEEVLRLIALGRLQVDPLITHRFALDDAGRAYDTIMSPGSTSLGVVLEYPVAQAPDSLTRYRPVRRIDVAAQPKRPGQLGAALVGAGNLARWAHLPVLKKNAHVSLRAIHSSSGARGKSYALRFGAAYCATDYAEILNDQDVDVVVIVSRNQHHCRQAEEALRAGKHVFVEKPMALTEDECVRLYRAVEESGRQLTVGFNRRFAPFYRELKQAVTRRSGPAVINCRVNSPGISGAFWMADPATGGAILGEACHFVDVMYWLLDSEPISVSAFSLPTDRKDPIGENNLAASFHFADGSIANLTYCTVGTTTSGGERVEVFAGGIGVMTEDFKRFSHRGALRRDRTRWWADKGYKDQMDSFLEGIRQGRPPEVGVIDGARATIGCLRMLDSARALGPSAIDLAAVLG
jgi:predicted dehydrogenase/threonine dehydrogenase-like Zn-dependent dehydrogenase